MPIHSIEFRVYVHATEDRERVLRALKNIIPEYAWDEAEIVEETYQGHYGNPITVITVRIRGERAAKVLDDILSRMSKGDKSILAGSIEERVDKEGTLYFRLSKQDAFLGRLILYEADDVVRISVSFTGKRREAVEDYKRRLEA